MTTIYTSSFVSGSELTPEGFPDQLVEHAGRLEQIAEEYRKLAKYIQEKNVKIIDAKGLPHGGSFEVDEIDTGRLKQAGFVTDFADNPEDKEPPFYIDTELDAVLEEERLEFGEDSYYDDYEGDSYDDDEISEEQRTARMFGTDYSDDLDPDFESEVDFGEELSAKSSTFKLHELLSQDEDEDEDSILGTIEIAVTHIDEDRFAFHIVIPDIGPKYRHISFDREKSYFKYKMEGSSEWQYETLESVYRSTRTASALLSNIVGLTQDSKELSAALEFVDRDLRLLQNLIREDYAIEDNDRGVPRQVDDDQ